MPTYQYACRTCDHRFEAVQAFHEDALRVCPQCEAADLRKLFGNVGVVFKGSGFYRNDSRSSAGNASAKKSNGSEGAGKAAKSDSTSTSSGGAASGGSTSTPAPAAAKATAS